MTKSTDSHAANTRSTVQLFTDGACLGNPGPGGWCYLLKHPATGKSSTNAGGEMSTTNNRMELSAVIEGLSALTEPCIVKLHSDSKYVINGLSQWMHNWKKHNWHNARKKPVLNDDLWKKLDMLSQKHQLTYQWVKGHSGHPENEHCDLIASQHAERFKKML